MMNLPLEQQLLAGIEKRNDVIARQHETILALEARIVQLEQKMNTYGAGRTPEQADLQAG